MPPPPRNFENRTLFHGDNLEFLRGMNSETIDLIATDPPFKKGRDFHATPDSLADGASFDDRWRWVDDVQPEWLDAIRGNEDLRPVWQVIDAAYGASGEDMAAFLCFLGVRLIEMHRVLKPTGSIYLHADDTAGAWIKAIMDAVFGRKNFRNAITWKRQTSNNAIKRGYGRNADTILFYSRSAHQWTWNQPYFERSAAELKEYRRDERGLYKCDDLTTPGARVTHQFTWRGATPSASRSWKTDAAGLEAMLARGEIELGKDGNAKLRGWKRYLDGKADGQKAQVIWTDIDRVGNTAKERIGYPTQKPLALYERIIAASSNPGDMVLDPFAGCATTPIAAERLGREWIGMDLWDKAHRTVLDRLADEGLAVPEDEAGERMGQARMLTFGEVHYEPVPPERTDDGEEAAPFLPTPTGKARRQRPAWQRMTKADMVRTLADAQRGRAGVVCAGCGVELAARYFELDHREPKGIGGEDWITNRVLLCGPCNGRKSHRLTLAGLRADNSKPDAGGETWMVNALAAEAADARAREAARAIRDG